jgi:putative ABC transport system ATP-binding protein
VTANRVSRTYGSGHLAVHSVNEVSLDVYRGEIIAVMGPSGSGKTTLLHLLGGLDSPDSGEVRIAGVDWQSLAGEERAAFRREKCAFVLQGFSLMPQATAAENVELPLLLDEVRASERADRVAEALALVDLDTEAAKLPDQLSGGQQQRVAIARAIVMNPAVVLADEPTGSLDSVNAEAVVGILVRAARERGASVVLVTHDPAVAEVASQVLRLERGSLHAATPREPEE